MIKLEVLLSGTSATELEPLRPHCKDAECFEFTFPDNLKSLHFVLCPEFQWDLWQASELGDWKNGYVKNSVPKNIAIATYKKAK